MKTILSSIAASIGGGAIFYWLYVGTASHLVLNMGQSYVDCIHAASTMPLNGDQTAHLQTGCGKSIAYGTIAKQVLNGQH